MKRSRRPSFNHALMTVPVAAMMLGASQSQAVTSIGINFWGSYGSANDSNNGRVVSNTAFGVPASGWSTSYTPASSDPTTWTYDSYVTAGNFTAGPVTVDYTDGRNWFTGTNPARSSDVFPGETDVINGGIYGGGTAGPGGTAGFTVTVTHLAAAFPSGYVIQPIVSGNDTTSFLPLSVSDNAGTTTQSLDYPVINTTGGYYSATSAKWALGNMSSTLTGDTLSLSGPADDDGANVTSGLAGVIITDKPVVTQISPKVTTALVGDSFTLTGGAIGIGTLTYQWRHGGVNIPGANNPTYTVASAAAGDSGNYDVVVTSSLFPANPATSPTVTVGVSALQVWTGSASNLWNTTATNWLRNGSPSVYANGLTTRFTSASTVNDIVLNTAVTPSSVEFPDETNYTISGTGSIGGTAGIVKAGAGEVTLSTTNSFTGNTTIGGGVLEIAGSGTLGAATYPGDIANGGELILGSTTSQTLSGVISGGGFLTKLGSGTITTTGNSIWTGATTVGEGTLEVQQKAADNPYFVAAGATLKIGYSTGGGYASTKMEIQGSGVSETTGLYLKGGTTYNAAGVITLLDAPTTIRQYGTGLANLGTFDVNGVGLACTDVASGSVIDSNIQIVQYGYGMAMKVDLGENNATGDLIVNGPLNIHNYGYGLIKRGTGSLRLNAAATAENEALQIEAGSVITGINDAIGVNADLATSAPGTLVLNGTSQSIKKLTGAGHIVGGSGTLSTLTVNPAIDASDTVADAIFNGVIGGTGTNENNLALVKTGANVLTLGGAATHSGATTISGGTLVSRSIANSAVSVASTAKLLAAGTVASLNVASGGTVSPDGPPPASDQLIRTAVTATTSTTITTGDFQELHNTTGVVVPNATTYVYSGEIYLPGTAGTTYYFGENFDDSIVLTIGGTSILTANGWDVTSAGSFVSPGPGWYTINLQAGQGGGGVGPVSTNNWAPGKGVGFTTTAPVDPLDGNAYQAFTLANLTTAGIQVRTGSGQLTSTGNVTLAGTYSCDVEGAGSDKIAAGGNLNLTGSTLDVNLVGVGATQSTYVIASYTGTLTGTFGTVLDLPSGYTVNYNTAAHQVELVSGSTPTGYAAWIAGYFPGETNAAIIGATADPDKDGQANSVEFALGGAPNSPTNNAKIYGLSADSDSDVDSTKELLLTIAVRSGTPAFTGSPSPTATAEGYIYTVQGSTTLTSFTVAATPVSPVTTGLPTVPAGYQYRTFSLSGSNGTTGKGFLRVTVTP